MLDEVLVVFFIGGLVGLDTTAAWQFLISHPLVVCPIVGLLLGEPRLGLFFGITFELIWLYDLPIGAAKFPEGNNGSLIGFMVAYYLNASLPGKEPWIILFSCVFAVAAAYLLGLLVIQIRKSNIKLANKADHFAQSGDVGRVEWSHLTGILKTFVYTATVCTLLFATGSLVIAQIVTALNAPAPFTAHQIQIVFLGTGVAIMFQLFFKRRQLLYLVVSTVFGIIIYLVI